MIPSAPSSAENLSPVPVKERGRVPINKTILESQRKSPFCSHPLCFPTLYFYKHGGPRPTAFTQRSQLHIVAAGTLYWCWQHPPRWPPSRRLLPAAPSAQAMSSARGKGGGGFQTKITQTHTRAPPAQGRKKHNKGIVRSGPGGLGPQTLGYCVPGPGLSPHRAQPLDKRETRGAGVLLKQGGQMKGSQTDAQTQASSRKARRRERQVSRRGGGQGRGRLFPGPRW